MDTSTSSSIVPSATFTTGHSQDRAIITRDKSKQILKHLLVNVIATRFSWCARNTVTTTIVTSFVSVSQQSPSSRLPMKMDIRRSWMWMSTNCLNYVLYWMKRSRRTRARIWIFWSIWASQVNWKMLLLELVFSVSINCWVYQAIRSDKPNPKEVVAALLHSKSNKNGLLLGWWLSYDEVVIAIAFVMLCRIIASSNFE